MKTSQYEKKVWAEFNTPQYLIDKMLNILPATFWQTPKKIWEPCCGKGGFVLSCFNKLFIGLEQMYPDTEERSRIILEECLYFSDINPVNVQITTDLLQTKHKYKTLGKVEDILQINNSNSRQYDLIVGNPPFNASLLNNNIIWPQIVKNALTHQLLIDGYLLFIVPPGWRKPDKERSKYCNLFSLLTQQNDLIYLEMHNKKDGRTTFGCNTFFDWVLVQKREKEKDKDEITTTIIDTIQKEYKINMATLSWLPNSYIDEILIPISLSSKKDKVRIIYSRCAYGTDKDHINKEYIADKYIYPCIHSTPKSGTKYYYSSRNDRGHFGKSKVIFGESGIYNPILDWEGKYGITHCAMGIEIDSLEEGNKICAALVSEKFQTLIKACMCSSFRIEWSIIKEFHFGLFDL